MVPHKKILTYGSGRIRFLTTTPPCALSIYPKLYTTRTNPLKPNYQPKEKKSKKMVLLEKLWDDVVAGPQPERGLGKLRKINIKDVEVGEGSKFQRSVSMPASPATPATPVTPSTPSSARKADNVWRSVFHPGSNLATKTIGANVFDKPAQPNSPTVYDWLYSGETRSKHR